MSETFHNASDKGNSYAHSTNRNNVNECSKTPSTASSIERLHQRTPSLLKDLVQTSVTGKAHKRMTFVHHKSIDTI